MNRSMPRSRRTPTPLRLSTTWAVATAAGSRIAGQVDRLGPGQQQADVTVDGCPRRGRERQREGVEPGLERSVVLGRELRGVLDARRERLTQSVHDTPPVVRVPSHRAAPLPASASSRTVGFASVFRRPSGSRPGLPEPLADSVTLASAPVRMPDGRGPGVPASTGFSTKLAERWTFRGKPRACVNRTGRPRAPAVRACAGRRR